MSDGALTIEAVLEEAGLAAKYELKGEEKPGRERPGRLCGHARRRKPIAVTGETGTRVFYTE